ncbi:CDP-glycerol glycerophosphotransferase family protein [Lactobacillus sp. ESL0791]|uniref:CDP-glycerol glycerophosphotransferase family protein n=1 Tax=Lactobacillus sp. ESL0791 TaxID=2983234 RepID=UPI0023F6FE82|nr:CDP-glycerol glycerophosphotransferase family protein [Lactobacillus sp. ESL0791]MDF7639322.1 CDP-glycerol glycerophosphotransferase family protein [Lactobacillus sp. ESL0791]
MKSFLFRLYLAVMKFCARLVPMKDKHIVILNGAGRSGSNGYLFYKYLRSNQPDYDVSLVEPWPSSHLPWSVWRRIGAAKYVITTHQPFKVHKGQVNVQFWHGVPLKRMGLMAFNTKRRDNHRNAKLWRKQTDIMCSSSDLYETLMSACIGIEAVKYQKLGFPRLDSLQQPIISKEQLLKDLFAAVDKQAQIGIYMPTFRYELADSSVMVKIKAGNFFAFADFSGDELNSALKTQHQYLIVKLHPYEMRLFSDLNSHYSNIAFLNNSYLEQHDYDLYELLGDTDFLMTDFSSIYFDYLHLDKPIIFITNYLVQYEKTRGLLLGPYKEVVPGQCVETQAELLAGLQNLDNKKWQQKRAYWLALTDQVNSSNNCADIFAGMTGKY